MKHLAFIVSIAVSFQLFAENVVPLEVDFAREVLPILSNKCFVCHGPDTTKKDLVRLDSFAGATRDLGGYQAVNPKIPSKSELLKRIHSADDPMPPKEAEKQLTPHERDVLSQWVRQGGEYATHWSFVPPKKQTTAPSNAAEAIDLFIQSDLKKKGIGLAAMAEPATLARRAALVLTGLPPEPDQLQAYLADKRPDAYERLVDQLMASPRYGEHQARYWLDAVRYGDTHGLHLDNRRGIYPYRDWVVRAFNTNQPLDEFITWQLAGDLLPGSTVEQQVATGFVRMNVSTAEGGAIPDEFQAKNNFDRTETLGTMLLGMSLTCARCHSHKYDPISQTEYYSLLAFFNSTAEHSMDGNAYIYGPVAHVPKDQAAWREWHKLLAERTRLLAGVESLAVSTNTELVAYAASRATLGEWRISKPVDLAAAPTQKEWNTVGGLPGVTRNNLPSNTQAIWLSFEVKARAEQSIPLHMSGGPGSRVFLDGKPLKLPEESNSDQHHLRVSLKVSKGDHIVLLKMVGTKARTRVEVGIHNPWLPLAPAKKWSTCAEQDRLRMLADADGPLAALEVTDQSKRLADLIDSAEKNFTTTLIAKELPTPRLTKVLSRGEYDLPVGEPLKPGILSVMGKFPDGAPHNRLGLAKWLTSRDHPLVARVLVNRVWQRTFGHGIVRTPEDFGLQGEQPTHPALLDWLAVELHESGWDLQHMLRLMVTSKTFRQSSAWRNGVDDPENRLFARGPIFRLDAEVIRDIGLWASGLLSPEMGGEGIKPYQPVGLWKALMHPGSNTKQYVQDKGSRLYRRSLYVYWKRTSPHPMMSLFDAPNRESSCVKRSRSNTSLQSLGLLNETQRVEMSRMLAERIIRSVKDSAKRLDILFELLACRPPTAVERKACERLLQTMVERYAKSTQEAEALLSIGEAARDKALPLSEHAAWTQLATTVLASDVAILLY